MDSLHSYIETVYRSTEGVQLNYLVRAPTVRPHRRSAAQQRLLLHPSSCYRKNYLQSRRASPGSCGQRHSPWTSGAIPWHVLPVNPGRHEQKNTCTSGTIQQVPPFSHGLGMHTCGRAGREEQVSCRSSYQRSKNTQGI